MQPVLLFLRPVGRAAIPAPVPLAKSHPALYPGPVSQEQAEAGNYRKRAVAWNGLTLRIENEAGSVREGHGWQTRMLVPYGEVERSEGMDGDRVDVFLGPNLEDAPNVYVVHQRRRGKWDEYDEDKCMLGFLSEEDASVMYLKHYDDARFLGPITAMPVAEFVAKCKATREAPAMIKASWFGEADLLKATLKKMITVPGYTKGDGTWVPPHQKMVHYNPEHLFDNVATGGVSHSQKQAHAKLAKEDWFQKLAVDDKALHVMSHATDIQDAASASAAVSGWKAAAKAGKNPSAAQWSAFNALPKMKQAALYDEAKAATGNSIKHLQPVGAPEEKEAAGSSASEEFNPDDHPIDEDGEPIKGGMTAEQKAMIDEDAAKGNKSGLEVLADEATTGIPEVARYAKKKLDALASKASDADAQKKLDSIESSGSFYQKEALKKLKAQYGEVLWNAANPSEMLEQVMALYKQLQGAASQASAVSMWKKSMLAGKVPSPAQHAALIALNASDKPKYQKVFQSVVDTIGPAKTLELMQASEIGSTTPAASAASGPHEGETKDGADGSLVFHDGHWVKQDGGASSSPALPPGWQFDASDSGFSESPTIQYSNDAEFTFYAAHSIENGLGNLQVGVLDAMGSPVDHDDFSPKNIAAAADSLAKKLSAYGVPPDKHPSAAALQHLVDNGPEAFPGKSAGTDVAPFKLEDVPFATTALAFGISSTSDAVKKAEKLLQAGDLAGAKALADAMPVAKKKTKAAVNAMINKAEAVKKMPDSFAYTAGTIFDLTLSKKELSQGTWDWFAAQPDTAKHILLGAVMASSTDNDVLKFAQNEFKTKGFGAAVMVRPPKAPAATPAPTPAPAAAMKKGAQVFQHITDGHYKQWAVSAHGNELITTYGAIGKTQSKSVKTFATPAAAMAAKHKLVDEKIAKGYHGASQVSVFHEHSAQGAAPAAAPAQPTPASNPSSPSTFMPDGTALPAGVVFHQVNPVTNSPTLSIPTNDGGYAIISFNKKLGSYTVGAYSKTGALKDGSSLGNSIAVSNWLDQAGSKKPLTMEHLSALKHAADDDTSGPKDGDTKQGADGMLVFKDGHWHKVDQPKAGKALSKEVVNAIEKRHHSADGATGWVPKWKSKIQAAKNLAINGDVAGLQNLLSTTAFGPATSVKDYIEKLVAAMGGDVAAAPTVMLMNPKPAPKASKPAPAVAAPANAPGFSSALPKAKSGEPQDMSAWTKVGEKKGSNPGGSFKDKQGKVWYCKFPSSPDIARNEVLAAKFYQMLGFNVPNLKLVRKDNKVGIASAWVDGVKKADAATLAKTPGALEGFVVDAWLGNWDVVGASNDNLMIDKNGKAIRVDVGGSLIYRAQGGQKNDFDANVKELDSMLDPKTNPKAAAVFQGISEKQKLAGAKQLNKLKPSQIRELVAKIGPGNEDGKQQLVDTLIARRAAILKHFGLADQWAKKHVDETKVPVDKALLPKPLDFQSMNSGKGLSSKAHVNAQNSKDSAALVSFASKGNLKALKEYEYDAVNKETGAVIGKKAITEHPANLIQQQWASLVQMLQSIAYPPVEALDMPPLGLGGSLEEVAGSAGAFGPHHNVTTVPAEHRFGYFMALGHIDADNAQELAADLAKKENYIPQSHDNAFIKKGQAHYAKGSTLVKQYTSGVQGSGSVNHVWSQGKASWNGVSTKTMAKKIYDEAMEVPEGMMLTRWMDDDTAADIMTDQLKKSGAGSILQNTDSMCASMWKSWQNTTHFCSEPKKAIMMKIRCAKGAKVTPSYGSGNHWSEGELTTLPGQRFLITSVTPGGDAHPNGIVVECIMLPPDPGYVAQLNSPSPMVKALFVKGLSWLQSKRIALLLVRSPSPVRADTSATPQP